MHQNAQLIRSPQSQLSPTPKCAGPVAHAAGHPAGTLGSAGSALQCVTGCRDPDSTELLNSHPSADSRSL